MSRFVYTPEMIEFVSNGYKQMGLRELTQKFNAQFGTNKTWQHLKSMTKARGITCGRKNGELIKGKSKIITPEQDVWLREHYQFLPLSALVIEFNKTFGLSLGKNQLRGYIKNNKITCGRTGQFEAGHKSWNKGLKGTMGPNATSFKKGHIPANSRPIGAERLDKDGYVLIKTDQVNPYTGHNGWYRHKHVVVWEQHHGPIPDGFIINFKDGDRTNCGPDNLELVSMAEHGTRSILKYHQYDADLKPTIALLAKVIAQNSKLKKEANA